MKREAYPTDQRLTVYLPDGASAGRVLRFTETGLVAYVDTEVPRDAAYRFTLHLQGGVVGGEVVSVGQEGREVRLQFTALTVRDRERLAPFMPVG